MPPVKKSAAVPVNFGSPSDYSIGGGFLEGDYALEFEALMHDYATKDGRAFPPSLTVKVTCHPIGDPDVEAKINYYGMGKKAHESYQPNPDDGGKSLIAVPGGPGKPLYLSTNWGIFLKSLYDSGLPEEVFTNSFTTIDGVHAHMTNIPEPEDRKSFQNELNEGGEVRRNKTIAVVTEIKEDGKPWEGTGGIPGAEDTPAPAPKAKAKTPAAAAPKAPAKPAAKAPAKPAPAADVEDVDSGVQDAAVSAFSTILGAKPAGVSKLVLRVESLKYLKKEADDEMATAVVDTYFENDELLNNLLGQLGYQVANNMIKPV